MIENICLDDKYMYLFIDIENVGYVTLPLDVLDKYKVIAVSSRDKDGLRDYKNSYPQVEVVYLTGTGKQLVDFYIYRNAVQLKVTKSDVFISVISKDNGYRLFSGLYGDIDFITDSVDKLITPITTTIVNIESNFTDTMDNEFDLLFAEINDVELYDLHRIECMTSLIEMNIKYVDLDYYDISMKDFKVAKLYLDSIRVSKLKGLAYNYFSTLKESIENSYRLLDKENISRLLN